jgi:hypothetical protein
MPLPPLLDEPYTKKKQPEESNFLQAPSIAGPPPTGWVLDQLKNKGRKSFDDAMTTSLNMEKNIDADKLGALRKLVGALSPVQAASSDPRILGATVGFSPGKIVSELGAAADAGKNIRGMSGAEDLGNNFFKIHPGEAPPAGTRLPPGEQRAVSNPGDFQIYHPDPNGAPPPLPTYVGSNATGASAEISPDELAAAQKAVSDARAQYAGKNQGMSPHPGSAPASGPMSLNPNMSPGGNPSYWPFESENDLQSAIDEALGKSRKK